MYRPVGIDGAVVTIDSIVIDPEFGYRSVLDAGPLGIARPAVKPDVWPAERVNSDQRGATAAPSVIQLHGFGPTP